MSNIDLPTVQKWMVVGAALRRLILGRGKAAQMYSYNGVVLPKLPETDLPYMIITIHSNGYMLRCFSDRPYYIMIGAIVWTETNTKTFACYLGTDVWEFKSESEGVSGATDVSNVLWSNTDIMYGANGTNVVFSASAPVPVYE